MAAFEVDRFQLPDSEVDTRRTVGQHGLDSFTTIQYQSEHGGAKRYYATVRMPPEETNGIAAVKRDPGGEPEICEAIAFQHVISVQLRYFPLEQLLLVFGAKQVAKHVFSDLVQSGVCRGRPVRLDLKAINDDPAKQDIFNAWAEGTGTITSKAYFGREVLDHEELRRSNIRSILAGFLIDEETVHLHVAAEGRITYLGRGATNDGLEKLLRRLLQYRVQANQTRRLSV